MNLALENRPGNKFAARAITEALLLESDPGPTCTLKFLPGDAPDSDGQFDVAPEQLTIGLSRS